MYLSSNRFLWRHFREEEGSKSLWFWWFQVIFDCIVKAFREKIKLFSALFLNVHDLQLVFYKEFAFATAIVGFESLVPQVFFLGAFSIVTQKRNIDVFLFNSWHIFDFVILRLILDDLLPTYAVEEGPFKNEIDQVRKIDFCRFLFIFCSHYFHNLWALSWQTIMARNEGGIQSRTCQLTVVRLVFS